jgi:hypothetical protein
MLTDCRYAWDSATVIGLFCGFAGNILVWAAYNYWKGDKALIPFSMMARTVVWSSCLFLAVLMGAMMGKFLHLVGTQNAFADQRVVQLQTTTCRSTSKLSMA